MTDDPGDMEYPDERERVAAQSRWLSETVDGRSSASVSDLEQLDDVAEVVGDEMGVGVHGRLYRRVAE